MFKFTRLNLLKNLLAFTLVFFCLTTAYGQDKSDNVLPFSSSLIAGDFIFLSGKVGTNPETGKLADDSFGAEVRQVMENPRAELENHGLAWDDLVSTIVYLKDMKKYDAFNAVYKEYFSMRFPTEPVSLLLRISPQMRL